MRRTESAILNDPDIWNVTDSDDEFPEGPRHSDQHSEAGGRSRRNSEEEDKQDNSDGEEQDMARYLVEQAPSLGGPRHSGSNINALWRKTAGERNLILKREKAVKGLCELCILRCIRPDHLIESMDRFVLNVLDPNYFDFEEDILAKLFADKNKKGGQKEAHKDLFSAAESPSKKALG
jgi:hypothetical protein